VAGVAQQEGPHGSRGTQWGKYNATLPGAHSHVVLFKYQRLTSALRTKEDERVAACARADLYRLLPEVVTISVQGPSGTLAASSKRQYVSSL
jgi:hypothetical protein